MATGGSGARREPRRGGRAPGGEEVVEGLFGAEVVRRRAPARRAPAKRAAAPPVEAALYAEVALNRPMRQSYTYAVTAALAERVRPGVRVAVPFAGRREVGVVVEASDESDVDPRRIKAIADVLDDEPALAPDLLELTRWMADYYACSWGTALAAVLPAAMKREGGRRTVSVVRPADGVDEASLAELDTPANAKQHRVLRTLLDARGPVPRADLRGKLNVTDAPIRTLVKKGLCVIEQVIAAPDELLTGEREPRPRHAELTPGQAEAVAHLTDAVDAGMFAPTLLYGVTGSGKTEVYLRLIEHALSRGKGAIVLVPEIALTPQTVGWFVDRFGAVAVLHSGMTDAQRLDMWERVRRGDSRVVVGARSAVFAPVADLGVIVVDEEHEPSYKQSSAPHYHARDVAVMRAKNADAVCLLGSATPSLESWRNAAQGRYTLLRLGARATGRELPEVEVVDMRGERDGKGRPRLFSRRLEDLLKRTLERSEQAILFINRRGFAPVLWCRECGDTLKCESCDTSMTWHKRLGRMVCHSCCDEVVVPNRCLSCTAPALQFLGAGSQRVEEVLRLIAPHARVGRMDSDTMLRREDYETTLADFGRGDLDVLVGTQMIAKGLDFPRVTLVGIVSADASLHQPDFRAAERTFQLVSQVAGRAGRGDLDGHIVVQTATVEEPAIRHAAKHDFEAFALEEDATRREHGYPPYRRLVRVVWEDEDEARVLEASARAANALREGLAEHGVQVLGPAPAPIALMRGRHRRHLLLKVPGTSAHGLSRARAILTQVATQRPRTSIDVDPTSMM